MTGLTWILTVTCVAGCCLSGASPVLRSAQRVQVGQNVSLSCNLTSSAEITWYLLRSDQLLPLLTVRSTKLRGDTTNTHAAPDSRIQTSGDLEEGSVSLEILEVEEKDAGLYFCTGRCRGTVCVNRGIYLTVNGVNGAHMKQPCWSLGICVLPGLLSLCFVFITGLYLCSGKPAVCCCHWVGRGSSLRVSEDEPLHYSSLRHPVKPRPRAEGRTGLVRNDAIYSAVNCLKTSDESRAQIRVDSRVSLTS
ncbi:uncharacterized protein [Channa argus]|uniref:uncharacterized protein isoform X2 n=1 Tax=Channa argus TaxID=215402 RepID=UPI0035229752